MTIVEKYVSGLKKAYLDNNAKQAWAHFERIKHGAKKEDIGKIKEEYPSVPDSFLGLLEYVDGTYWREYQGEEVAFYFLGSDVDEYEYPYYLFSSEEVLKNKELSVAGMLSDYIGWLEESGVAADNKITNNAATAEWLCFSNCMNNGGTSQLFVDFTPSASGKVGQVIRFLHDPDEFKVIADSFDDYLEMLIDNGYAFINEDTVFDLDVSIDG